MFKMITRKGSPPHRVPLGSPTEVDFTALIGTVSIVRGLCFYWCIKLKIIELTILPGGISVMVEI